MADVLIPAGVSKKILHFGKGEYPSYKPNSKATFHFKTLSGDEREELDDSRKLGQPFELLIGKKFKLEIWEELIKTMKVGEVAEFTCPQGQTGVYPVVSKSFRDMLRKQNHKGKHDHNEEHQHHCAYEALKNGLGYEDLNKLTKEPTQLTFAIELLNVEEPGSYQKDIWAMNDDEKLGKLPIWKEEGNVLLKQGKITEAAEKYKLALGCLEHLILREKPKSDDWNELSKKKIPFLLNLSQCCLLQEDYYQTINHTTAVLDLDDENIKALFRRGKAHAACWAPQNAKEDFQRVAQLDTSLTSMVKTELDKLHAEAKRKQLDDKNKFGNMFK